MRKRRTLRNEFYFPHRREVPQKLYKVFSQREHADNFLKGIVFFRSLTSLRTLETAGADPLEGQPRVDHGPANVTITNHETGETIANLKATSSNIGWATEFPEERFISCFSSFVEPPTSSKFGEHVVEIFDAAGMVEHWTNCIEHLECAEIEYYDPKDLDAIKSPGVPPWQLKEIQFEDEKEFRISFEAANLKEICASVVPTDYGMPDGAKCEVDAMEYDFGSCRNWARLLIGN